MASDLDRIPAPPASDDEASRRRAEENRRRFAPPDLRADAAGAAPDAAARPPFPAGELYELRSRWDGIQTSFVDAPRAAVERADHLVGSTVQRLVEAFARERQTLREGWAREDTASTEDLRQTLRRYRALLQRMLDL